MPEPSGGRGAVNVRDVESMSPVSYIVRSPLGMEEVIAVVRKLKKNQVT